MLAELRSRRSDLTIHLFLPARRPVVLHRIYYSVSDLAFPASNIRTRLSM